MLSLASIVLFIKPGLNYGVDFIGGIMIEATAPNAADLAALRDSSAAPGSARSRLQEFGDASTVLVRIERQPGDDEAQLAAVDRAKAAIQQGRARRALRARRGRRAQDQRRARRDRHPGGGARERGDAHLYLDPLRVAFRGRRDRDAGARSPRWSASSR